MCLKVIGIQSSQRKGDYLRAKSWGAIIGLLQRLNPDVGAEAERAAQLILSKLNADKQNRDGSSEEAPET